MFTQSIVKYINSILLFMVLCCPLSVSAKDNEAKEQPKNLVPGPMISPQAFPGGMSVPTGLFAIIDHVSYSQGLPHKVSSRQDARSPAGRKVGPQSNELFVNVLKFRYGLAWDRLDIRTSTPYLSNVVRRHSPAGDTWLGGWADTTVILRYQLKPRTDESPFAFAVDAGVVLPTGQSGNPNKYLATNAFGVLLGGGASWIDNNQRIDVDGAYTMYNNGPYDIKPGNYALFHGHYAYAFSRYFDAGVETWFRVEEASTVDGRYQDNSYSEWYAGPKIQFKMPEWQNLTVGCAVLFPLYRQYESVRLSPDARFEFRVSVAF